MSRRSTWYRGLQAQDRMAIESIAKWLSPINWQWFVTLTFPWNVRGETAEKKLRKWHNALERHFRRDVCIVAGMERKLGSHGMTVPWHFHVLVTCQWRIPSELLASEWHKLITLSKPVELDSSDRDDSILSLPYENQKLGLQYCLKALNSPDGDWTFRRLELFIPNIPGSPRPDHRKLRRRRRFSQRESAANAAHLGRVTSSGCNDGRGTQRMPRSGRKRTT